MACLRFVVIALLLSVLAHAKPALPFQRLDGCVYKPQRWNDGDSFHVVLKDGKEVIFRLYFVDTPEEEAVYRDRIAEQGAYFHLSSQAVMQVGREAEVFTRNELSRPFTVYTRWRSALGRSKLPRYYAVVIASDGKDLAQALVKHGLARIYGVRTPLPDGSDSRNYLDKLHLQEADAKAHHLGGWKGIALSH
ncbi:MAG: thermonuclease family protein [Chthoniobacteraceae bacterium]